MSNSIRLLILLVLAVLVGCGSDEDNITLYRVQGTILENGEPMVGASVNFVPDASNAVSTPGVDATGPDGNYLAQFKNRIGLAPGKYHVTVTPALDSDGEAEIPAEFAEDPMMAQLARGDLPGQPKAKKKSAGEVSEFDITVTENESENVFDFAVKSKSK